MVRFADSQCNRQQAHVIVKYLDDLASGLPHPSRAWRWGDVQLSHKCLYNLKVAGLIQPEEDVGAGRKWRTIEAAWVDVRERTADDVECEAAPVA